MTNKFTFEEWVVLWKAAHKSHDVARTYTVSLFLQAARFKKKKRTNLPHPLLFAAKAYYRRGEFDFRKLTN